MCFDSQYIDISAYITISISSVGEEYADDVQSCSKIYRPPRIGVPISMNTAVLRLICNWILVAVDCS